MATNQRSRDAVRSVVAKLSVALLLGLAGCHAVPVAPVAVIPPPGTVRVLGAVALPQVVAIPINGLTLGGAIELAGGVVTDQQLPTSPADPPIIQFDVQLKSPPDNPTAPRKNTLFVFKKGDVLFFHAFDGTGQTFLDLNESKLKIAFDPPITLTVDFKTKLLALMSNNKEISPEDKASVIEQVKNIGEQAGIDRSKWNAPVTSNPTTSRAALDPSQFLIGLRRIVNGGPSTTYFAVPLVLKYLAGNIPLQDGDLVRVVHSSTTILEKEDQIPTPGDPPAQITTFVGSLANASELTLPPTAVGQSYTQIRDSFRNAIDLQDFGTMNSLTRINPNDGGVETFILPNHNDKGVFPQYSTKLITSRKIQDGDVFGLTTLPQVPAIALPAIHAATDSLLALLRASQVSAPAESRHRRWLNSLGRGQIPPVAPVAVPTAPTLPTVPRSLDVPPRGAIVNGLQQHVDKKHAASGPAGSTVVPASGSNSPSTVLTTPTTR
jgi:hypothetical protein